MTTLPVPVLVPPPEIHDDSLAGFEATVEPHLSNAGPGLVINLEEVEFISSTGLGFLVRIGMTLDENQRRIALAGTSRRIARMIRLTGLEPLLPQFRTVRQAVEYVSGTQPA